MHGLEEMVRVQPVDQIVREPVVDHHRAQSAASASILRGSCCGSVAAAGFGNARVAISPALARRRCLCEVDCVDQRGFAAQPLRDYPHDHGRSADHLNRPRRTQPGWRSADVEQERRIAIFDLIEENYFAPQRPQPDGYAGPYRIKLESEEGRLGIHMHREDGTHIETLVLALGRFRRPIKDYFAICDSYYQAIRAATPQQIETIDMAVRVSITRRPRC